MYVTSTFEKCFARYLEFAGSDQRYRKNILREHYLKYFSFIKAFLTF